MKAPVFLCRHSTFARSLVALLTMLSAMHSVVLKVSAQTSQAPLSSSGAVTSPPPLAATSHLTLLRSVNLSNPSTAFAFTRDNKKIAFVSNGGGVRLWNVETGELQLVHSGDKPKPKQPQSKSASEFSQWVEQTGGNWISSIVALSPDGKKLAVAGVDAVIHLCDLQTGQEKLLKGGLTRISNESYRIITTLGFSSDGQTLVAAGEALELWDLRTGHGHLLRKMERITAGIALSPDGTSIAVTDVPFSMTARTITAYVELRDIHTGKVRWTHSAPTLGSDAAELDFSPDGKTLAAVGDTTKLWDTHTGTVKGEVPVTAHGNQFFTGALTPDAKTVAVVIDQTPIFAQNIRNSAAQIALYDVITRKPLWKTPKLGGQPQVLGFNADGTLLIGSDSALPGDAGSGDVGGVFGGSAVVRLWDAKSGKLLKTLTNQTGLALSPDGTLLLTRDWETNSYQVWRLGAPPPDKV